MSCIVTDHRDDNVGRYMTQLTVASVASVSRFDSQCLYFTKQFSLISLIAMYCPCIVDVSSNCECRRTKQHDQLERDGSCDALPLESLSAQLTIIQNVSNLAQRAAEV